MTRVNTSPPDLMPVLSAGKHRSPRRGACFMEMASYLAGERWSDHPHCTHPLVAALARMVNDGSTDAGRSQLGTLIPSVVGLTSDDPHVNVLVALHAAGSALPVAGAQRQHALATAILACRRALIVLDGQLSAKMAVSIDETLAQAPDSARWARRFVATVGLSRTRPFSVGTAASIVRVAVDSVAHACVSDADDRLRGILRAAIDDCARYAGHHWIEEPTFSGNELSLIPTLRKVARV